MSFSLLLPSALAALLALAIPVLIHLSRRAEHKLVDFAAMRWLEAHLRPQRKWQLQELILLAIRLLLLTALAFYLAQPVWMQQAKPAHWVLVTPGADISNLQHAPNGKHVQWHWLSTAYPAFDQAPPSEKIAFSSLLRELDSQLPKNTELTVIVPEKIAGLDGERIRLSRKVNWLVTPGKMQMPQPANALKPIRLAVRYDAAHATSADYFRAVQRSWNVGNKAMDVDVSNLSATPPQKGHVLVWLASGKLPEPILQWLQQGGVLMASNELILPSSDEAFPVWRDSQGIVILRVAKVANGRVYQWQVPLVPARMPVLLDANFPAHLSTVLNASHAALSASVAGQQHPQKVNMTWLEMPKPLGSWLVWIIVLLFAVERWLSGRNKTWSNA